MASWGKKGSSWPKGKGGKNKGKGASEKKDYVKKVAWEHRLSKWSLRPYVDQQGSPFMTSRQGESQFLSTWQLSTVLNEGCSEYCARQGVALSEGAANLEVGIGALLHHFGHEASPDAVGISKLLETVTSAEGKKFMEALAYLNTVNEMERSEEGTAKAVKRFLRYFSTEPKEKEKLFKKLLRFGARIYLMGFEGLEALTAIQHPSVMAAGMRVTGQQMHLPSDVKAWLKDPEDSEALMWAMVAGFQQQKLDAGRKKRSAGEMYDWEEEEETEARGGKGKSKGRYSEEEDSDDVRPAGKGRSSAARPAKTAKGEPGKKPKPAFESDEEPKAKAEELDLESSEEEESAKSLDVTKWPLEKIEEFKALLTEINTKEPKERPGIAQLQEGLAEVPDNIVEHMGLQSTVTSLKEKTRYPKQENLKKLIEKLMEMTTQAEAEWKKSS